MYEREHVHEPPATVTISPLKEKRCPRCGQTKPMTEENWYLQKRAITKHCPVPDCDVTYSWDHWRPGSYCRPCTHKAQTQNRTANRQLAKLKQTDPEAYERATFNDIHPCDVCGVRKRQMPALFPGSDPVPRIIRVDLDCLRRLRACSFSLTVAIQQHWMPLVAHMAAERKAEAEWRSNRPRRTHQGRHQSPPWPHRICVIEQIGWAQVVKFLAQLHVGDPLDTRSDVTVDDEPFDPHVPAPS